MNNCIAYTVIARSTQKGDRSNLNGIASSAFGLLAMTYNYEDV